MKQKTNKNVILDKVAKQIEKSTASTLYGWPPGCMLIAHQPKRPTEKR